jgi:hypothetical protein
MAYFYEVSFHLDHHQLEQLKLGKSLEKVIGYMRVLLPSQPGFVSTQALLEVSSSPGSRVVFTSEWENWEDYETHRQSALVEDKILLEFDPHIRSEHLEKRVYREVE